MNASNLVEHILPNIGSIKDFLLRQRLRLVAFKEAHPETAAEMDADIALLDKAIADADTAVSPENLIALVTTVAHELAGIKAEGLKPSQSPGVVTGG